MTEFNQQVLSIGLGKAAHTLHGPNWLNAGYDIVAYDTQAERLRVDALPEHMQAAHEAGRLSLIADLDQLSPERLAVIDVVTSSGYHAAGAAAALEALENQGASGGDYTWLLEKPVVSSPEEEAELLSYFQSGRLLDHKTFVNENYNASSGVILAKELIGDTPVANVDVVFYKDRVPDVKKGRFTDAAFGAYGIEMPHMVAVAHNLAGLSAQDQTEIVRNDYLHGVAGIAESTGNYTVVRGHKNDTDVMMRMAQGLGPYEINGDGRLVHRDLGKSVIRYSDVTLQDGRKIMVEFDPVPGLERYTSRVSEYDADGYLTRQEVLNDNSLATVIGGVATFQRTGKQPVFAEDIRVGTALAHVHSISGYVADAKRQGTFPVAS